VACGSNLKFVWGTRGNLGRFGFSGAADCSLCVWSVRSLEIR
jgi:hypothetical protein